MNAHEVVGALFTLLFMGFSIAAYISSPMENYIKLTIGAIVSMILMIIFILPERDYENKEK